jgi:hypothetical protein
VHLQGFFFLFLFLFFLCSSVLFPSVVVFMGASAAILVMRACLLIASGSAKGPKPSDAVRLGALSFLGSLFSQLGPEAGAVMQEASEKLCKLCKSKTLCDGAVAALGQLVAGLGDSTRIVHEAVLKSLKAALSADKSPLARQLVARSLGQLGAAAGAQSILEPVLEILLRLLEDADSSVYSEAQTSLSTLMSQLAARRGTGVATTPDEEGSSFPAPQQWNLVTAAKFVCVAMKKTVVGRARGGLGYALTHLLFASRLYVKEDALGALASVVLGLVLGQEDVAQLRAIASHILRHGLGKTLGTAGRRKFMAILLKSVDNAISNEWVRVAAFGEIAHLLQELGEEGEDLFESTSEVLQRHLSHGSQPLRHAVVSCLVSQAEAAPAQTAKMSALHLEQFAVLTASGNGPVDSPETRSSAAKLTGHTAALVALLAQGARSEFGLPQTLMNRVWQVSRAAVEGRSFASAGWAVLGSAVLFGASVVTPPRLALLFDLLRSTFVVNDKLSSDKAVLSYVRQNENTLSTVLVVLDVCQSLLSDQHFLVLTQVLNQVITSVSSVPAACSAMLHSYKNMLYEVFFRLPPKFYQSSSVALLKLLAGDIVEGPLSSLSHSDLSPADYVLESMAHASSTDLFEAPSPDLTVHALRNQSLAKRLFFSKSLGVVLVDSAIALFPIVFATQQAKRQSQVIMHLIKCASVPIPGQQRALLNSLCAVSRALQSLAKLRIPIGPGPTQSALLTWLTKHCLSESDALVRRNAARCLGLLCRVEGPAFTVGVLKTAISVLLPQQQAGQPQHPSFESIAGAAHIVAALHKMTGAIQMASFQEQITQSLLSRLALGREVYPWILHALWLVIEARGPGFAPLANSTLNIVYNILTGPVAFQSAPVFVLLGRVANAIVSVLGLELQPGSKTFKRFSDISAEMRAHSHALVQQEALAFKQMLILFAPRTVDVQALILQLRRELRSSFASLRTAAIICTNQLLQMSASSVVEQHLEQELFFMLDDATGFLRSILFCLLFIACFL